MPNLYAFINYKDFLREAFASPRFSKGIKTRFAEAIRCQLSFVSQVLNGKPDLSMEQALRAAQFFGFSPAETDYFLTLVQRSKSADGELRLYFDAKIEGLRKQRNEIPARLQKHETLDAEAQTRYYSSWIYSAIHILAALPETNSRKKLKRYLKVRSDLIDEALNFLVDTGLLTEAATGHLTIGEKRLHLPKGSPMLSKHHENWRRRALDSSEFPTDSELHYTLVMGVSEADYERIRKILLSSIEKTEKILLASKESKSYALLVDLFSF